MADEATENFDTNYNMRAHRADLASFYEACKTNGEPDASTVVRRMMADYADGSISYSVQHEDI